MDKCCQVPYGVWVFPKALPIFQVRKLSKEEVSELPETTNSWDSGEVLGKIWAFWVAIKLQLQHSENNKHLQAGL